jgi:hypothetical protein
LPYILSINSLMDLFRGETMQPVDMVGFLIAKGFSEVGIAKAVGTSQPTIHRIKCGSGTTYETGKRIENMFLAEKNNNDLSA